MILCVSVQYQQVSLSLMLRRFTYRSRIPFSLLSQKRIAFHKGGIDILDASTPSSPRSKTLNSADAEVVYQILAGACLLINVFPPRRLSVSSGMTSYVHGSWLALRGACLAFFHVIIVPTSPLLLAKTSCAGAATICPLSSLLGRRSASRRRTDRA